MRRSVLLALAMLAAPVAAGSLPPWRMVTTPEEGPVDPRVEGRYTAAFNACQAHAVVTDDNARCFAAEFPRQDSALNAAWRRAMAAVAPKDRPALLAAQRRWIAARDPFCRKVEGEFAGGSIRPVIWHSCRAEQTIRRTLWLERVGR